MIDSKNNNNKKTKIFPADLAWKELKTENIVDDQWINFRKTDYELPDGYVAGPFYTYSRRDYVVIVASDEDDNYICVKQFRQGIRRLTTEFPAGGIELVSEGKCYRSWLTGSFDEKTEKNPYAEDPLTAAKRELKEETGYESDEWTHLISVPSDATICDNYAHLFRAVNCRRVSDQSLDDMEFIKYELYNKQQINELISGGEFEQAMHILAWQLADK